MGMEAQRLVEMMVVVAHVEPVLLDKNVAWDIVSVNQTAMEDFAGMMDVEEVPAVSARQHNPVPTVFVLELRPPNVATDNVEATEPWDRVVPAPLDRDAEGESVSAIMTVTKETAVTQSNPQGPTLDCALKDHVAFVPMVSPVATMEDARPWFLARSRLLWLIVQLEIVFRQVVQFLSPQLH